MPSRILLSMLCLLISQNMFSQAVITLDHKSKIQNPTGVIRLSNREFFDIVILNTNQDCFDYNVETVKIPGAEREEITNPQLTATIHAIHDEKVTSYVVSATKKSNITNEQNKQENCELSGYTWTIPVETYGWNLSFSGGFTADGLTDPVFFLEPVASDNPSNQMESQQVYKIREDKNAKDQVRLGATAFIHLYHNGTRGWQKYWAPISFGLKIGDEQAYYLGSTLKFGSKLFVTGGVVLGERTRLPDGLQVSGTTSDVNALKTLGTRTEASGFISISFSALTFDFNVFKNAFPAKPETRNDAITKTNK